MLPQHGTRAVVLLAEDDPADQELTRRALQNDVFRAELHIVSNGEAAIQYLERSGIYAVQGSAPRPDIMLLDLNLPRLDGRQVLTRVRANPSLCTLPVVILTTSQQEEEIIRSYKLGCSSFITKPVEIDQFIAVIRQLGSYWFELVTLPRLEGESSYADLLSN